MNLMSILMLGALCRHCDIVNHSISELFSNLPYISRMTRIFNAGYVWVMDFMFALREA